MDVGKDGVIFSNIAPLLKTIVPFSQRRVTQKKPTALYKYLGWVKSSKRASLPIVQKRRSMVMLLGNSQQMVF